MIGRPPVPAKVRFWRYVRKRLDGCWWWTGSVCRGYGQFRGDGPRFKMYKAHVFSWKLHHGEVPKGLLVCHSCDVRHCVNPNHLWLGTQKDNLDDMRRKGRQPDMICGVLRTLCMGNAASTIPTLAREGSSHGTK